MDFIYTVCKYIYSISNCLYETFLILVNFPQFSHSRPTATNFSIHIRAIDVSFSKKIKFTMPCLVFTGHPSAGKSGLAKLFQERALASGLIKKVVVVNEESACPGQSIHDCYATSQDEKKTRGALKSAFDRVVGTSDESTLVILDSMNYIKGFRYELYCISKAANQAHGVVWVLNNTETANEWNSKRKSGYSSELFHELVLRYEPPDARNRWDSPLYRISVTNSINDDSSVANETLAKSVYNMHSLKETVDQPVTVAPKKKSLAGFKRAKPKQPAIEPATTAANEDSSLLSTEISTNVNPVETQRKSLTERIDDILREFLGIKPLQEGTSTRLQVSADADVLHNVDSVTYQLLGAIGEAQRQSNNAALFIRWNDSNISVQGVPENLKQVRSNYLSWVATHPPEDTSDSGIAESFLSFMEAQYKLTD